MKKAMFRWLIALAILLPCVVFSASAATEGYYTYSVSNGKATITDVTGISGAVTIPSTLGGYPVTAIGVGAFYDCDRLTGVTIPSSVTSIGDGAFEDCGSLTRVTIGNSVTSIGDWAFYDCDRLTGVTIPDSVTSIGKSVFQDCDSLTQIKVTAGNTAYCDVDGVLFNKDKTQLVQYPAGRSGSYTIPDSVTYIGDEAFDNCDGLTSVIIPDSVTSIGDWAFDNCDSLTSVTIPDSVTHIGQAAFAYCDSLTSVTIPDSVTSIGDWAFCDCDLTSVTIPDSVTSIGKCVFQDCYSLTGVTIGNSVTAIGEYAFEDCGSLGRVDFLCDKPAVGSNVFYSCENATIYYHEGTSGWPTSGTWQGRPLVMQPHIETVVPAVAPTCVETGLTEGEHCSVCGEVFVEQVVVPATGHSYQLDEAVEPTCVETGLTEGEHCPACGEVFVEQEVIPATGLHGYQLDKAVEATCTKSGLTVGASCPTCGYIHLAQEVIPAVGHKEVTDAAVEATCTATGLTEGSHCGTCGDVLVAQKEVPVIDHTPVTDPAVAPTCLATGLTEGSHCGVCGEVLVAQQEVGKTTTHSVVIDQPRAATCTEVGYSDVSMHCGVCGEVLTPQTVIPALGHDLVHHEGKKPTEDSVGWTDYDTCTRCDYTTYKELQAGYQPTRFKFSLEVVNTIVLDGKKVEICRWVWTPVYD